MALRLVQSVQLLFRHCFLMQPIQALFHRLTTTATVEQHLLLPTTQPRRITSSLPQRLLTQLQRHITRLQSQPIAPPALTQGLHGRLRLLVKQRPIRLLVQPIHNQTLHKTQPTLLVILLQQHRLLPRPQQQTVSITNVYRTVLVHL